MLRKKGWLAVPYSSNDFGKLFCFNVGLCCGIVFFWLNLFYVVCLHLRHFKTVLGSDSLKRDQPDFRERLHTPFGWWDEFIYGHILRCKTTSQLNTYEWGFLRCSLSSCLTRMPWEPKRETIGFIFELPSICRNHNTWESFISHCRKVLLRSNDCHPCPHGSNRTGSFRSHLQKRNGRTYPSCAHACHLSSNLAQL